MINRRVITVTGVVQGVGFRPFVRGLALELGLGGSVRNHSGTVHIEVEGDTPGLDRFCDELPRSAPPHAEIHDVHWREADPRGEWGFRIEPSESSEKPEILLPPDIATCDDCLGELFDPHDRRYRYPFLNCTRCGPRLSLIRGLPYDRLRTTMSSFPLCDHCRAEYEDSRDRRFHAQPVACAACGPRLGESLAAVVKAILEGRIAAIKGIGGYHLACDALNVAAVKELRRRKRRDEKPFAVLVADVEAAERLCVVSSEEMRLLSSFRRPIVILERRPDCPVSDSVAPGSPFLGLMLSYSPLHHLLARGLEGRPLVLTSGNVSDEPMAYRDQDASLRLGGIADIFLPHDREIHRRCDDSVARVMAEAPVVLRRARGYAPAPVRLPFSCPVPILAVGGQLKNVFALGTKRRALLSSHLGDLDEAETLGAFQEEISTFERLFEMAPKLIACDEHPDYASTGYARDRARRDSLPVLAVQHHHAHMASCMAENGLDEEVIGVTFDGLGFGDDGALWGGEFLVGDYSGFRRAAHLRYTPMPGGMQAIREPWRLAVAQLRDAGVSLPQMENRIPEKDLAIVEKLLEKRLNAPLTSSCGRLFDAVAALLGVKDRVSFEGQAAIALEGLATGIAPDGSYPFAIGEDEGPRIIDTRPLIEAIAHDMKHDAAPAVIARRFHSTVAFIIVDTCRRIREGGGSGTVVFSGGVFMNAVLLEEARARLLGEGFRVHTHRHVPPNDGGLCLGQLAVAARQGGNDVSRHSR